MNIPLEQKNVIFKRYVKDPEDKLRQMLHDINKFEAKFKEDENLLDAYRREYESKKRSLEAKGITKNEKATLTSSIARIQENLKKLSTELEGLKQQRTEAQKVKYVVENYILKGVLPTEQLSKFQFSNTKRGYILSIINLHKKNTLSPEELRTAKEELNSATTKEQMKRIYDNYRQLALNREPSTQAITSEQIEQEAERGDPLEEVEGYLKTIQSFSRAKLSGMEKGKHIVLPKPPKRVSETQTSQTQTLLPLNAFKFIEKNNAKFLEPLTPEKAEELAIKKKTVTSAVLLDPNRYKRRPYVVRSQ